MIKYNLWQGLIYGEAENLIVESGDMSEAALQAADAHDSTHESVRRKPGELAGPFDSVDGACSRIQSLAQSAVGTLARGSQSPFTNKYIHTP